MRLTDDQIRDTVAKMNMTDKLKAKLLNDCLIAKSQAARFVVFFHWKRQQGK